MNKNDLEKVISIRLSKELHDHLKKICISTIRQTGKMYTLSNLIRETLEEIYPPPKQLDFFEE